MNTAMNYSMMTYTMARQGLTDMKAICRMTRDLGLAGIDQVMLYDYEPRDLRRMADDIGVRFVCYTFFADISFADAEARRAGVAEIIRGVDIATTLGAPMIMVPIPRKHEMARDEQRKYAIDGFAEAIAATQGSGVKISTEHFPDCAPFATSADMNELTSAVPQMYVTFDAGCTLAGGEDPTRGFMKSRDKIIHAHLKDYVEVGPSEDGVAGLSGKKYRGALIGEGLVEYLPLITAMKHAGYAGCVNLEYEGNEYPAETAVRKMLEYLKHIEESIDE